ncbi:MAG: tetratricopeptide repeat protein [Woeseiaceae bacterium]
MSIMFWGIAITMLVVAIGVLAIPMRAGNARQPIIVVMLLVPAIAVGLYSNIGSPQAASLGSDDRQAQPATSGSATNRAAQSRSGQSVGSVASMLAGLEGRLEREPNDAGSWLLLAKSYQHLNRLEDAVAAYERASELGKSDVALEKLLVEAGQVIQPPADDSRPALRGRVSLSADADELVSPDDTVFIFAKESREHRMPVVALRRPASELPLDFILTDDDAMVAGTRLEDYEQLVITAKISRSGMATDAVDGLESWSEAVSPRDQQKIELVITGGAADGAPNSADNDE